MLPGGIYSHVPIFFVDNVNGSESLLFTILVCICCIPLSILLSWLYINKRGSLFLCILFNVGLNSGIGYVMGNKGNDLRPFEISTLLFTLLAIIVILKTNGTLKISINKKHPVIKLNGDKNIISY